MKIKSRAADLGAIEHFPYRNLIDRLFFHQGRAEPRAGATDAEGRVALPLCFFQNTSDEDGA